MLLQQNTNLFFLLKEMVTVRVLDVVSIVFLNCVFSSVRRNPLHYQQSTL